MTNLPPSPESNPTPDDPGRRDIICPATGELCLRPALDDAGDVMCDGPVVAIYEGIVTPEGPALGVAGVCPRDLGPAGLIATLARQWGLPTQIRLEDEGSGRSAPPLRAPESRRPDDEQNS
jgi:hypothetical protein